MITPGEEYPVSPSITTASGMETTAKQRIHRGVHRERRCRVFVGTARLASIVGQLLEKKSGPLVGSFSRLITSSGMPLAVSTADGPMKFKLSMPGE